MTQVITGFMGLMAASDRIGQTNHARLTRWGGPMRARYVGGLNLEALLDPEGQPWKATRPETVAMIGTPTGLQPSPYIIVSRATTKIGAIEKVSVSAVHDGSILAFRLEWSDANENRTVEDTTAFADAAGVLLPSAPGAAIASMGAPGLAVNAWHWRADDEKGRQVVAEGLGTTRTVADDLVRVRGIWKSGSWKVVLARPLRVQTTEPVAQLEPGQKTQFGVAIWEGSHGERAGIKAFSVDCAPTARR
jgi:DMSO reductase family type II enzyme heme b subunit